MVFIIYIFNIILNIIFIKIIIIILYIHYIQESSSVNTTLYKWLLLMLANVQNGCCEILYYNKYIF